MPSAGQGASHPSPQPFLAAIGQGYSAYGEIETAAGTMIASYRPLAIFKRMYRARGHAGFGAGNYLTRGCATAASFDLLPSVCARRRRPCFSHRAAANRIRCAVGFVPVFDEILTSGVTGLRRALSRSPAFGGLDAFSSTIMTGVPSPRTGSSMSGDELLTDSSRRLRVYLLLFNHTCRFGHCRKPAHGRPIANWLGCGMER